MLCPRRPGPAHRGESSRSASPAATARSTAAGCEQGRGEAAEVPHLLRSAVVQRAEPRPARTRLWSRGHALPADERLVPSRRPRATCCDLVRTAFVGWTSPPQSASTTAMTAPLRATRRASTSAANGSARCCSRALANTSVEGLVGERDPEHVPADHRDTVHPPGVEVEPTGQGGRHRLGQPARHRSRTTSEIEDSHTCAKVRQQRRRLRVRRSLGVSGPVLAHGGLTAHTFVRRLGHRARVCSANRPCTIGLSTIRRTAFNPRADQQLLSRWPHRTAQSVRRLYIRFVPRAIRSRRNEAGSVDP